MEDKNIIDYGELNIPEKWEDIDLKTYQEIEKYYEDKKEESFDVLDVIDILTGKDKEYIKSLPMEFLDMVLDKLSFLTTEPQAPEPTNSLTIDGETYTIHFENQLKVGEYIAADSILKSDKHNYAALLAILCRKDGELYDSHFENEVIEDRIKFWEKQPVTKVLNLITFFLQLANLLYLPTLLSSQVEEAINLTRNHIETSHKNGEVSKRSMKSAMKKLTKLEKSIKNI